MSKFCISKSGATSVSRRSAPECFQHRDRTYTVTISPARVKDLDGSQRDFYPSTTEDMKPSVRTSLDIPTPLHRRLHEAAARRGCSARQLILASIERIVAEELPRAPRRVDLPCTLRRPRRHLPRD
jgi:hypothetical protein